MRKEDMGKTQEQIFEELRKKVDTLQAEIESLTSRVKTAERGL